MMYLSALMAGIGIWSTWYQRSRGKVGSMETDHSDTTNQHAYIYALIDPRDGQVRYVGRSVNPKRRYLAHLGISRSDPNEHKKSWIRVLQNASMRPILKVLEEVAKEDAPGRELWWIQHGRDAGWNLTNILDGEFLGVMREDEVKLVLIDAIADYGLGDRSKQLDELTLTELRCLCRKLLRLALLAAEVDGLRKSAYFLSCQIEIELAIRRRERVKPRKFVLLSVSGNLPNLLFGRHGQKRKPASHN